MSDLPQQLTLPLDREGIKLILPHREPFLLLDRALELEPGVRAVAEWTVQPDNPVLVGHFPGHPVYPGVLALESLAQAGALALLTLPEARGRIALFGGVERLRWRRQVLPGDTLRLETTLSQLRRGIGRGHGVATVNGEVALEGDLIFAVR